MEYLLSIGIERIADHNGRLVEMIIEGLSPVQWGFNREAMLTGGREYTG